jgi:hypothetical protein
MVVVIYWNKTKSIIHSVNCSSDYVIMLWKGNRQYVNFQNVENVQNNFITCNTQTIFFTTSSIFSFIDWRNKHYWCYYRFFCYQNNFQPQNDIKSFLEPKKLIFLWIYAILELLFNSGCTIKCNAQSWVRIWSKKAKKVFTNLQISCMIWTSRNKKNFPSKSL